MIEEKKELTRIDVNIEKMPIIFFGTKEKKRALEKQIFASGKPYEILARITPEKTQKLSIAPNAAYGMLTEFDQDVIVAVFYHLFELSKILGACPQKTRIPLSEFPKIMFLKKHGRLYKNIEKSALRISSFEILQDNYLALKQQNGELKTYEEKSLKLFRFSRIYKEEKATKRGKKIRKHYLELEIPGWVINNIENLYTTEFDVKKYFLEFRGGRTRKLYRLLELIRYNKTTLIPYEKLQRDLWIGEKEPSHIRRTLKRVFTPLAKSGYLTSFELETHGVLVTFSSVKKRKKPPQLTFDEIARQDSLVLMMLEKLEDVESEVFYRKAAQKYPEDLIYKCLSLTQEVIETKKIKKSKGAIFTDILKRESVK